MAVQACEVRTNLRNLTFLQVYWHTEHCVASVDDAWKFGAWANGGQHSCLQCKSLRWLKGRHQNLHLSLVFLHFCPSFTTASISDFKLSPCRGSPSVILVYKNNKSSQDLLSWRPRYPSCSSSLLVSGRGISFDGRPRPVGVLKTAYIQWKFSSSANRIKWTNLVHRWAWAGRM